MSYNNLNNLAKRIAQKEGGKKQVNIAQIKEIIKLISMELYRDLDEGELAERMINQGRRHVNKLHNYTPPSNTVVVDGK